ncbi:universal stress protein [Nonomuraea rubra]|uniref:universal stress protein n=1 Tax=Nonomuraea rubra TaxID=46180 RepID=UPI001FE6209A|nr:universal stress protein [Nonomuraea rubra]
MLVGSVAYGVAGHAPCDVVVVRQTSSTAAGEVVAGADGSRLRHGCWSSLSPRRSCVVGGCESCTPGPSRGSTPWRRRDRAR